MGYSVTPTDKDNTAIGNQIKAIQADPINRAAFFTHKAMIEMDLELLKSGNVFIAIWKDKDPVGLRAWSNSEISDIMTDPEDAARPLFYIRQWRDDAGKERRVAYPSMFALPEEVPAGKTKLKFKGTEYDVDRSVVVYHVSARKPLKAKFALNEFVAACRWAKPHEKFIEDFHAIASAYRKYSHMMTTKGTASQSSKIATQFKGDTNYMGTPLQSNPVGSMVVATEGNELKTISAGSGNIIGIEGARASLMQVCAATGVPETYLTMDPSTGNLATAKEISPVFITMIEERQTGWKDALTDIFTFILESDEFEVSFAPIRDNIQQYVANVNAFAWSNGQWTGAMKGKDYIKAGYEALEWKLPSEEDLDEMGDALDNGAGNSSPEDNPYSTDTDLGNVATAALELTQAVKEAARLKEADDDVQWITVGGQHIPIKSGQSKGDAVKQAFGDKGGSGGAGGSSSKDSDQYQKAMFSGVDGKKYSEETEKKIPKDTYDYGFENSERGSPYYEYAGSKYEDLNYALRKNINLNPDDNILRSKLDNVIDRAPKIPDNVEIFRGVGSSTGESFSNIAIGDEINDNGFQSFSLNPSTAESFTEQWHDPITNQPQRTVIRAFTKDTEGIYVNRFQERELLVKRGTLWKVIDKTSVERGGTKVHIISVEGLR
jgi:hypothetical protein